jgi:hypothetical protein
MSIWDIEIFIEGTIAQVWGEVKFVWLNKPDLGEEAAWGFWNFLLLCRFFINRNPGQLPSTRGPAI